MSTFDKEQVLNKIRGLAEIANPENGAFPGEIANASAMLQRMMDQYNISWVEVMNSKKEQEDLFTYATGKVVLGKLKPWHWSFARCVARITTTRHYSTTTTGVNKYNRMTKGGSMSFFGTKEGVAAAVEIFDTWVVQIDEMAKTETAKYIQMLESLMSEEMEAQGVKQVRHLSGLEENHPNVWRDSWLRGVIFGINEKLTEQEKQRETTTSNAIVLVKDAVEKAYADHGKHFRKVKTGGSGGMNGSAFSKGQQFGRTLNVTAKRVEKGG